MPTVQTTFTFKGLLGSVTESSNRLSLRHRGMRNLIAAGLAVVGLSPTAPAMAQTFRDTPQHWANACIERLAAERKLNGYPDGSFRPENPVTRAEFAVLMLNSFPTVSQQTRVAPQFRDVSSQHWAYRAIQMAYQTQIFVGYPDNTFRPDQPITRVEALAILSTLIPNAYSSQERGLAIPPAPEGVLRGFLQDAAQTPPWAQKAIAAAASGFLIVDYPHGQRLRPQAASSRADVAAFLCQAFWWDGLVPMSAVAGNQHFVRSSELERLQRARADSQPAWFDAQRRITVFAQVPSGWGVAGLNQLAEGRVGALFQTSAGDSQYGYFDQEGKLAIAPQFETAGNFSEGLAPVSQSGKYGFIDLTGRLVIPLTFDAAQPFSEGLAAVRVGTQWGFIDRTGAWVIPPQPYAVLPFSDGLARIEVPDDSLWRRHYGFIDRTGQQVIAPTLTEANSFSEGLAAVSLYDEGGLEFRYGYINKTGTWVIQNLSRMGGDFADGLAPVQRRLDLVNANQTYPFGDGYIDQTGQWVIPPQHFRAISGDQPVTLGTFTEGFASISVAQKIGFINRQGEIVVPLKFSALLDISDGYAQVNYGGIWVNYVSGYDSSANPVIETRLENGRWGYIQLSP